VLKTNKRIDKMEYTDQQKSHFREEFSRRKKRRLATSFIVLFLMIGVTILTFPRFVLFGMPKYVWGPVFTLIVMGGLFYIIIDWRCPVCNGILGNVFSTNFCSKCGFSFIPDNYTGRTKIR